MDEFRFASESLEAAVKAQGAELCSLRHPSYGELLWQAEPAWPAHAPNLFPIVGQLVGDVLRTGDRTYPLLRHGFARRRRFTWVDTSAGGCTLELGDDDATREQYPYPFRLRIAFALAGPSLSVTYTVRNTGTQTLPASVGAHPAFRWPLAGGVAKSAHTLEFAQPEPAPIRRLQDGLLKLDGFPSPVRGRTLVLDESLFAADAIVMDVLASRSLTYSAPGTPAIDVAWDGFRDLGIWSKLGADFVCIEPWYGYASPLDFDGPFERKPGLLHIPAGDEAALVMRVTVR